MCAWTQAGLGQNQDVDAPAAKPLFIEVLADGRHCRVRDARVLCTEVLSHLRNVLKLAPGSVVRFRAGRAAPHEAVKSVMDELTRSEYRTPAAIPGPPK
jgi:biopolymer transport protein ExbD